MTVLLDRLINRPVRTSSFVIPLDPAMRDRIAGARARLLGASGNEAQAEARAEVDRLEAENVTVRFDLRAIGPRRQSEIIDANRAKPGVKLPDGEQRALTDDFAPALLAEAIASVTFSDAPDEPVEYLDVGKVAAVLEHLSIEDETALLGEALRLDREGTQIREF